MRYISHKVAQDLKKKRVLISGPRQTGKTTLVKELLTSVSGTYLNWDDVEHRRLILKRAWSDEQEMVILDEIHKYSRWKNFLKGTYDTQKEKHRFLVTGSARLDVYKRGQDSMMGRYFSWHLHPLCLSELRHTFKLKDRDLLARLLEFGGFPEPFFISDPVFSKRWRLERKKLVFRQDVQELEQIRDISLLELFYELLTERVGSEIVLAHLARDLEVAPKTAKAWLQVLEKTHALFLVTPYSRNLAKAVVKAPKVYFYDNAEVQAGEGARFENLVACHLYKKAQFLEDSTGERYQITYVRDQQGHEIDFLILKNSKPHLLVEAKVSDSNRSRALFYFMEKLKIKQAIQLVRQGTRPATRDGVTVIDAEDWLARPLEEDFI